MNARWPFSALLLIASSSVGLAAPATPDGAIAIEQGYVDYFGKAVVEKGIVSVAPTGEDYVVTWDLQKAFDLSGAPKGALQIEPFSYTLTPGSEGSWIMTADRFPSLAFDLPTDKGKLTGTLDLSGLHLETAYDAARVDFLRSLGVADLLAARFHLTDVPQGADFDLLESGLTAETRAKTSSGGAGIDVALAQSAKNLSETVVARPQNGQDAPVTMTYNINGGESGVAISGLRAREIANLWKFAVAHIADSQPQLDYRTPIRAALPLWNSFQSKAEIHDLTVQGPMVEATLQTLGETIGLTGFVADGAAEIGINIDALAFKSPLLPPWSGSLSPASFNFDLRVTDKGLDEIARLAIDDPNFGGEGELTPETQEKIGQALLAGRPKLILAPGRLTIPALDLAFEGEASADMGGPSGHFTISADGLDKTIALLGEIAKTDPDMQPAVLGVTFLKGLATTGPDGRLVWKIDVAQSGDVSVNGRPLPSDK